jgi:alkylated DNA repair dioxygenase AlkB
VPYRYSGQTLHAVPLSERTRALVERAAASAGGPFNHVLYNLYRNGRDHIGFHADNEPELGRNPLIASLSLGAVRRFRLERKGRRGTRCDLLLEHGSLLVMGGSLQHHWYHALPKAASLVEPRLNVTFRWLTGPPGWREAR